MRYLALVVGLYLFFLLARFPAAVALNMVELPDTIRIGSVTGTIWSGQANRVVLRGISLEQIKWRLSPWALLVANLSLDVEARQQKQFAMTQLQLGLSGNIALYQTRFSFDLAMLQPLFYGLPLAYEGKASGYFPELQWKKQHHVVVNGKLSLTGIGLLAPRQQQLGDYVVRFQAEKNAASSFVIQDAEAQLGLDGRGVISKDGMLDLAVELDTRGVTEDIRQTLAMLGRKTAQDGIYIKQQLRLW